MPNQQVQSLSITVAGLIDPSLARMISDAENKLKGLGLSVKQQNETMIIFFGSFQNQKSSRAFRPRQFVTPESQIAFHEVLW